MNTFWTCNIRKVEEQPENWMDVELSLFSFFYPTLDLSFFYEH